LILQYFQDDYRNFCNVIPKSTLCAAILEIDEDSAKAKDEVKKLKSMLADFEKRNRKPKEE